MREDKVTRLGFWTAAAILGGLTVFGFFATANFQTLTAQETQAGGNQTEEIQAETAAVEDCRLGINLIYGLEGTHIDYKKGLEALERAAEGGDSEAQGVLAWELITNDGTMTFGRKEQGFRWVKAAPTNQNPYLLYARGRYLKSQRESGSELPLKQAAEGFRERAQDDDPLALFALALCYMRGDGVAKNQNEAAKLYRQAAELGNAPAANSLGMCYDEGVGVALNKKEARRWIRRGAEAGDAIALTNMGTFYYFGDGVKKDKAEAFRFLRQGAEAGCGLAAFKLGYFYYKGRGVATDKDEAERWFRIAAEAGDQDAIKYLSILRREKLDQMLGGQGTRNQGTSGSTDSLPLMLGVFFAGLLCFAFFYGLGRRSGKKEKTQGDERQWEEMQGIQKTEEKAQDDLKQAAVDFTKMYFRKTVPKFIEFSGGYLFLISIVFCWLEVMFLLAMLDCSIIALAEKWTATLESKEYYHNVLILFLLFVWVLGFIGFIFVIRKNRERREGFDASDCLMMIGSIIGMIVYGAILETVMSFGEGLSIIWEVFGIVVFSSLMIFFLKREKWKKWDSDPDEYNAAKWMREDRTEDNEAQETQKTANPLMRFLNFVGALFLYIPLRLVLSCIIICRILVFISYLFFWVEIGCLCALPCMFFGEDILLLARVVFCVLGVMIGIGGIGAFYLLINGMDKNPQWKRLARYLETIFMVMCICGIPFWPFVINTCVTYYGADKSDLFSIVILYGILVVAHGEAFFCYWKRCLAKEDEVKNAEGGTETYWKTTNQGRERWREIKSQESPFWEKQGWLILCLGLIPLIFGFTHYICSLLR